MKKYLLSLAAIATMFASCTTDVDIEVKAPELLDLPTFTAELDETRTNFVDNGDGTGFVQWIENENLSIFLTMTKNRNMTYKVKEGSVKNGGKTADMTAVAMGVAPLEIINIDQNYAIYPYSENNGIKMEATGIITTKIANVQSFNPESDFANIPVVACSPDTNLSFFIPGSAYRLNVNCVDFGVPFVLKKIIFTSMSTEIAGDVEIAMDGTPEAVIVNNGSKSITLDLGEGVELSEEYRSFYIAMPSVEFPENDRTITYVYTIDGTECQIVVKKNAAANMTAGKIQPTSQTLSLPDFSASTAFPTNGGELVGDHTLTNNLSIETAMIVPAGEEATLNLNGKNIVTTKGLYIDGEVSAVICAKDGANLALFGEGAVDGSVYYDYAVESRGGNVVIKDGTYTGSVTAVYAMDGGTVTIEGGEFKVSESKYGTTYLLNLMGNSDSSIIVKGGKFYGFDPANNEAENPAVNFVADGYISVEVEENVWEVMPATETIEVASAAALEDVLVQGGSAVLTDDIAIEKSLVIADDKSATLDLNGNDITVNTDSNELGEGDAIIVYGDLTINGEGTVTGNTRAVWARSNTGATVTINGGTYVGSTKAACEVIYASGNGQIVINDGDFSATNINEGDFAAPQYAVLNLHGNGKDGANITVYGGTFHNFDPANNISENPVQSFVAEGYASVKTSDEVYEVVPLDEAYNMPNAVITLTAGTYTLPTEFAEGVTLNCQEGVIFEGQSSLDINGAKIVGAKFANTDEKGKVATGVINGEFVDCVFEGDYALRNMKLGEKASFDGCEFIGLVYGVHFDGATTTNTELVFNDCDFTGWNSFGTAITKVTMTGCRFHHSGDNGYGRLRFYQNAVVENSTFDERYDGIDFGDLGNGQGGLESTFTGCAWTNKNIVDLFVFTGLDTVIIDGETYPVVATTADAVVEALANGDVVANATISVASELDGKGNTLFVDNELTSNHIVTASNDATIKNLNIEGGNIRTTNDKATYALYFTGGNIVVDNVSVDEVAYTINYQRTSTTASEFTLTVSNSTLTGWTSWGTIDWAKFNDVHFGIGTYYEKGSLFCGGMRPYATTTLENCTFDKNFYISTTKLSESVTITMKNCKVNGVVLTKDNWMSYLKVEGENTEFVLFE